MKIEMMGSGLSIIQGQKEVTIPADRRLPRNVDMYSIKENLMKQNADKLKERHLAECMGLEVM